jgi:hypothetical protein
MSYDIFKTDGNKLTTLSDGNVDTVKTDLTLVGKNYSGFGQYINENFVKLLENFATSGAQPTNPLEGQLWYDKSQGRLKVYTINGWKGANGTLVEASEPKLRSTGDIWINSSEKRMYFYVGNDKYPASKIWNDSQYKSGLDVVSTVDTNGNSVDVLELWISDTMLGIFSPKAFKVGLDTAGNSNIPGYTTISAGFTTNPSLLNDPNLNFIFDTIVRTAKKLLSLDGITSYTADDFLKRSSTQGDQTLGKITIKNDNGLTVGNNQYANFKIDGVDLRIENVAPDGNIYLTTSHSSQTYTSLKIDATTQRVGIVTSNPTRTLDVNGDMVVGGPLKLASYTDTTRSSLSPANGDIIYNTTQNKFQGYANGSWANLN